MSRSLDLDRGWAALACGGAIAALAGAEYAGAMDVDRYAIAMFAYGVTLIALGIAARYPPSTETARQLLMPVVLCGFVAATLGLTTVHPGRYGFVAGLLGFYILVAEDLSLAACLMGLFYVFGGTVGALGLLHADHPDVALIFGAALVALGMTGRYEPWRPWSRVVVFGILAGGLTTGAWMSGFNRRLPAPIGVALGYATTELARLAPRRRRDAEAAASSPKALSTKFTS